MARRNDVISLQISFEGNLRSLSSSLAEGTLANKLQNIFNDALPHEFIVKYQNEKKNLITLANDIDYQRVLQQAAVSCSSPNFLQLFIVCTNGTGKNSVSGTQLLAQTINPESSTKPTKVHIAAPVVSSPVTQLQSQALALIADVLENLIFSKLSPSGLVCARMVCRQWHHIIARTRPQMKTNKYQRDVSLSLFRQGAPIPLMEWFERYLKYRLFPVITGHANVAARNGHLFLLQHAPIMEDQLLEAEICSNAAAGGHLEVLKWARANGCEWDTNTCPNAAAGGHLEVLKWARANGCMWPSVACAYAAEEGYLEILKWARANDCEWDSYTCAWAARGGQLEVLKWARANGCMWDSNTCACAAYGHFEVLQWARANGCEWNSDTCANAARGGHLEMLKWARANGCEWDTNTCASAALGGHLEVLKWARESGCKWDSATCYWAAKGGHLEVLKWAHANGCQWDSDTYLTAVSNGHHELANWARSNGCPSGD